jgi:hypothetical protein
MTGRLSSPPKKTILNFELFWHIFHPRHTFPGAFHANIDVSHATKPNWQKFIYASMIAFEPVVSTYGLLEVL